MRNIERLSKYITKYGTDGILVHTIYGSRNWLVCQKIELDKWLVTLCNPMGNVTFNLGMVSDKQHVQLWSELTRMEIEQKANQILLARELKKKINNFKKKYAQDYKRFLKIQEKKAKQKRSQCCRRNRRFKKSSC